MRKRIIDPEFFLNGDIAKTDYKTRLLYIGLWTLADDYGVLENDIEKIRIQIFPYTRSSVKTNIDTLVRAKKLIPYTMDEKNYFWIKNFVKYQWFSHPKHKYPTTPEITGIIQKVLANRTEPNLTKHNYNGTPNDLKYYEQKTKEFLEKQNGL